MYPSNTRCQAIVISIRQGVVKTRLLFQRPTTVRQGSEDHLVQVASDFLYNNKLYF